MHKFSSKFSAALLFVVFFAGLLTPLAQANAVTVNDASQASVAGYQISGNYPTSCAVSAFGSVECWGYNGVAGLLGNGGSADSLIPVEVPGLTDVVSVSGTCALLGSGAIKCWGDNWAGQLGDGTEIARNTPVSVQGISDAVQISVGGLTTCAVLGSGQVKCWGYNGQGQLGNGTLVSSSVPVLVSGLNNAKQVSVGGAYACAVDFDGNVFCWGYNDYGRMSNGIPIYDTSTVPVIIPGLEPVSSVGAGGYHMCVLTQDGEVSCWGDNRFGQLGDGSISSRVTPGTVQGLPPVGQLTVGDVHNCVVTTEAEIMCWGDNRYGQIGVGTTQNVLTPVSPIGLTDIASVSAGSMVSCAVTFDGVSSCWGINWYGGLGDGTKISRKVPTPVMGLKNIKYSNAAQPVVTWTPSLTAGEAADYIIETRVIGASAWQTFDDSVTSERSVTLTGLDINEHYEYRITVVDGTDNPRSLTGELVMPNNGLISGTAASIFLSWDGHIAPQGSYVSDFVVSYRMFGSDDWTVFEDGYRLAHYAQVTGLLGGAHYEFRVQPVVAGEALAGEIFSGNTSGIGTFRVQMNDSEGNPVSLGTYSWESLDGRNRSSSARAGTALGAVSFSSVPPKEIVLYVNDVVLADGSTVRGAIRTHSTNGLVTINLPEMPEQMVRTVKVQMPSGDPVPNASVTTNLFETGKIEYAADPTELTPFHIYVSRGSVVSGVTNSNGELVVKGFGPTFYTEATSQVPFAPVVSATYDDGELFQATSQFPIVSDATTLELDYMPIVQLNTDLITANLNSVVSVPVLVGDAVEESILFAQGQIGPPPSIRAAVYGGVSVSILPPAGASKTSCGARTVLAARTTSTGRATLKVCASMSGDYKIVSRGAVSAGSVKIRVRNSKPMPVTSLGVQPRSSGTALVAWGAPEYSGGAAITSYKVTATSGTTSKTITINSGTTAFRTRSINVTALAANKVWTFKVVAINRFGTSAATTQRAIIKGSS